MGGRGASSGKHTGKPADITYSVESHFTGRRTKTGELKMGVVSQSEGFKAILEAPIGTRITAHYNFGGDMQLRVEGASGKRKKLVTYRADGTRDKSRVISSVSQVKSILKAPTSITIHAPKKK